jgi:hypothetical protein
MARPSFRCPLTMAALRWGSRRFVAAGRTLALSGLPRVYLTRG